MTLIRPLSTEQTQAIRAIPHFSRGVYRDIDLDGAIDYYRRRYVEPLGAFTGLGPEDVVADIGTGYGWLAIAFALHSPARIIAVGRFLFRICGAACRRERAWRRGSAARASMRRGSRGT